MKKKLLFAFLGLLASSCYGAIGGGIGGSFINNANTLQPNATFYVSSGTVTNLQTKTLKFNDGTTMITAAAGGSGASSLAVNVNSVAISSPTAALSFDSNFTGLQSPAGTANISINPNSTLFIQNRNTLQTGSTFYVSSATIRGPTSILNGGLQALFMPSPSETMSLVNVSSHQVYVLFKSSGVSWWRVGNDVTNLGNPEFSIYNSTTNLKDIAISTSDVATISAAVVMPNLSASQPVKTNAGKQLITSLINLTSDVTGMLPTTNLPSNIAYTNVGQTFSGSNVFTSSQTFGQIKVSTIVWSDGTIQISSPTTGGGGDVFLASTQTFTGTNNFKGPLVIYSTRTFVQPTGDYGVAITSSASTTSGAFMFDVSQSTSNGLVVFDNSTKSQGGGSLFTLISTNTQNHSFNMRIYRNSPGNSNGDIRVDSPNPNFEFVDTSQINTDGSGKFEFPSLNSDHANVTGRNAANTAFQNIVGFNRLEGPFGGGIVIYSTGSLKFTNGVGSYQGFVPANSFTDSGSWLWTLPLTANNTGQILMQTSNAPNYQLAFTTGGSNGQVLMKNGSSAVWANTAGGSTNPGGSNTNIQFSSNSTFGGDNGLQYDSSVSSVTIGGALTTISTISVFMPISAGEKTKRQLALYNTGNGGFSSSAGGIGFFGRNNAASDVEFSNIRDSFADATAGSESGLLNFNVKRSGTYDVIPPLSVKADSSFGFNRIMFSAGTYFTPNTGTTMNLFGAGATGGTLLFGSTNKNLSITYNGNNLVTVDRGVAFLSSVTAQVGIQTSTMVVTSTLTLSGAIISGGSAGVSGQVLTSNGNGSAPTWQTASSGGGGGSSALEVFNNFNGARSSPTASIGMSNAFAGSVSGSTFTFALNSSSVTMQGVLNDIHNQNTLQSGATFYVSSGTINGPLTLYDAINQPVTGGINRFYEDTAIGNAGGGTFWVGGISGTRSILTSSSYQNYTNSESFPRIRADRDTMGSSKAGFAFTNDGSVSPADATGVGLGIETTRTLGLYTSNGTAFALRALIDPNGNMAIGTTTASGRFEVDSGSQTLPTSIFKSTASQISNLTEWRNPSDVILSSVSANGNITASTVTATTAFVFSDGSLQTTAATGSSGGSGGYAVEPATVTFQLNKGLSASTETITNTVNGATALNITSTGTANALKITANGTYGTTSGTSGGLLVDCTGGAAASGFCTQIYSNAGAQIALGGMLNIIQDNAAFNEPALYIKQTSTNGGAANARFDGPTPQIEWVETDQVSPAGKYEDGVNGDVRYMAGRNAANNSFDDFLEMARKDASGGGYIMITSTQTPLRFKDSGTHYTAFLASTTLTTNNTYVLPSSSGTANQVLATDGKNNLFFTTVSGGSITLASTQTWSGQNNWTTTLPSTFTYGLTVGSITVPGFGNTRVWFTNGANGQAGTSSTFTWNGSTVAATIMNPTSSFQVGGGSFTVKANGNWNVNGSTPTLSSCGTNPSVIGGGLVFTITAGSGGPTGCTATFANPLTNTPTCNITPQTGSILNTFNYTVSNTAVVISETGLTGNIDVQCIGHDKN